MLNTRPQSPTMATNTEKEHHSDTQDVLLDSQEEETTSRRVRFSVDENDTQSAPNQELTAEMISELWYTHEEVTGFKQEIRTLVIRRMQKGSLTEDEMAGLEKYHPQRSEYKKSAKHHILHAQTKRRGPEFLRSISRRCTAWARAIATEQGFHDYCAVYDPWDGLNFESVIVAADTNDSSVTITEKRMRNEEVEASQRSSSSSSAAASKRQRLSPR
ncbi:unnamed protein product [Cylindrotheca closterium]|uniref:Uncharacterized protein n=1 Tax=Cylindrotheca closterium TaxID=2856 RepID=A0AAD2CM80_9STRA|nr:unnamed protein product [Cylindrotheca closterium]CAJ1969864.1 unnamed protein product [Cylindrotheca closterium]